MNLTAIEAWHQPVNAFAKKIDERLYKGTVPDEQRTFYRAMIHAKLMIDGPNIDLSELLFFFVPIDQHSLVENLKKVSMWRGEIYGDCEIYKLVEAQYDYPGSGQMKIMVALNQEGETKFRATRFINKEVDDSEKEAARRQLKEDLLNETYEQWTQPNPTIKDNSLE